MPYISSDKVKLIRERIKKEFPKYKFSITTVHHSGLCVSLLSGDIEFPFYNDGGYIQINHYHYRDHYQDNPKALSYISRVLEIIHSIESPLGGHESSDYGWIPAYYINLHVGSWDKPYILMKG